MRSEDIASKPGMSPGIASETTVTPRYKSTDSNPTHPLERLPQVRARTGFSKSELYRRISLGTFPAPVKLGERASAWSSAEVDAWIADRIAARDQDAQR